MSDPREHAVQALKNIPDWQGWDARIIRELNSGVSSHSWLIRNNKELFVLRVDRPGLEGFKPDRVNEMNVRNFVATVGHAEHMVYFDAGAGVLLTEYVEGKEWTLADLQNREQLSILATRLKNLHTHQPEVKQINLLTDIEHYESRLQTPESFTWSKEAALLLIEMQDRPLSLCHGDVLPQNLIQNEKLWFIDWEYAGLGDPMFDLATVVQHHQLSNELTNHFLVQYFDHISTVTLKDFLNYRKVYDYLLALWYSVVIKNSPDDREAIEMLESVKARIDS
ncbi:MAG: phosphotransferase family protein [Gammaproteobacteria bacterium]|nr:phosphotransferase family protein [Gammaproteobacteria bacterium]NNM14940.1 phosphotransferase family protein [Gammaproteobacteria bacterium]